MDGGGGRCNIWPTCFGTDGPGNNLHLCKNTNGIRSKGTVVIIYDNAPGNSWLLGRVVDLPGSKALVCSVWVKTKKIIIQGPTTRLYLLLEERTEPVRNQSFSGCWTEGLYGAKITFEQRTTGLTHTLILVLQGGFHTTMDLSRQELMSCVWL